LSGRHALVVGAAAYPGQPLDNAANDAGRIADALRDRGFAVTILLEPDRHALDVALATFRPLAASADLALVYLAGHAVERHGTGYFLPIDFPFPPTPGNLRFCAIGLNDFVGATDGAGSRIVVLDACRDWPADPADSSRLAGDLDALAGDQRDWPNLLLAYATSAATRAGDGLPGEGSAFTSSLCRHLLDHGLTVDECFRRVSQDVIARRKQQPWTYSSLAQTLSFTDLPRFRPIQRHTLPNPEHLTLGAWTARDSSGTGMFVGLGDSLCWHLDLGGLGRSPCPSSGPLVGAAHFGSSLALAGDAGRLFVAWDGGETTLDLGVDPSFGIVAAPGLDGATHFGAETVTCLRDSGKRLAVAARHEVGFHVYCCTYLPGGRIWAGGAHGEIVEIDPQDANSEPRDVACLRRPVNAIAVSPDGSRVFVVGQAGLAVELDSSGTLVTELLDDRPLRTAAGIRSALIGSADDDDIRDFIFNPSALGQDVREELAEQIGRPSYHACAVAPSLPIVAIGTEESTVILLDWRDRQIFQELDVTSGHPTVVSGIHFLSDRELVVVGGQGQVTFFAS